MFGVILKTTNSSFQKCMTFCRSIHVKKVMKLLAFIFEQPSYEELALFNLLICFAINKKMNKYSTLPAILYFRY